MNSGFSNNTIMPPWIPSYISTSQVTGYILAINSSVTLHYGLSLLLALESFTPN